MLAEKLKVCKLSPKRILWPDLRSGTPRELGPFSEESTPKN
jgi:hypothetical protein